MSEDRRLRRAQLPRGLRTVHVPLGKKTIDGVESDGMLASAAELGISRDHAGSSNSRNVVDASRPITSSKSTTNP